MEPIFDGQTLLAWYHSASTWLFSRIFTPSNVVFAAMQIPAVVGAGFGAWWVHDFTYPIFEQRIARSSANDYSKWVLLTLASLIFPALWALGLWISVGVSIYFAWPHNLIWMAINLLTAWFVIRLASILVQDPIWSRMIAIIAYTIAVLNILQLLDPVLTVLDGLAFAIGSLRVSMLTVLKGMLALGILLWGAVIVSGILERRIQKLPNLTPSIQVLIGKLFKASLITLAVVVSLTSVGIDLTALAVFSGAVGVGIGFGLQKVVSNLISGIILLVDKSIKPGDVIQIGETYGWVSSLGARYVAVETRDGIEYLIPNEDIITKQVVSWTHQNEVERLKVRIRISYYADVDVALALMAEAATKPARVLKHPKPNPLLIGFADNGLDIELRFWIRDAHNGVRNISSEVMLEIWRLFQQHGVMVPFPPKHEVYLHPTPPPGIRPRSDESSASTLPTTGTPPMPSASTPPGAC